jgi:hypothetical protein
MSLCEIEMIEKVITVHGIASKGKWQQEIAPVLFPHFEPQPLRYKTYRWRGPLDLVFEPWSLICGLLLWMGLLFYILQQGPLSWPARIWFGMAFVLIPVLANRLAPLRLEYTKKQVLKNAEPTILSGHSHVIAHSLGTYIICAALRDQEPTTFKRIVLAGCVLNPSFGWQDLLTKKKYEAVRNEVAGRDWVASAARLLRWRIPDFGAAGRHGFKGVTDLVHTLKSPGELCACCGSASVHNYISAKEGHSGVLKSTYVKYYWLPFLWGMESSEFREFLNQCHKMMSAYSAIGSPEVPPGQDSFSALAREFLKMQWKWTNGRTVTQYINDEFGKTLTSEEAIIIVYNICNAVTAAEVALGDKVKKWREDPLARQGHASQEFDKLIQPLDPRIAVFRALLAYEQAPGNHDAS